MKTEQKMNEKRMNKETKKNGLKKENKLKTSNTFLKSFFDDFFEFPLIFSEHLKDLSIRQQFEEEKRIPVTNLEEFFTMCEKKYNKWDEIPVTNIREFFELCEKTPINSEKEKEKENKKPIKGFSKSYISTTIYKNGHRIDETKEILRNENGEEEIIKEKLIDGKGKKIINKNGKKKIVHENKKMLNDVLFTQRYPIHNIFNDYGLFNMRPRKVNNSFVRGFLPMGLLF